jgi:KUP system potassium uptake protein
MAWFVLVFPCLLLNYFGQGALALGSTEPVGNIFFRLAPEWFLTPLVIMATLATIIASQAVISGAFSMIRQSVQLGFWPRILIKHTSSQTIGQVYVPLMNWVLLIGTISLILIFRESGKLAAAYGRFLRSLLPGESGRRNHCKSSLLLFCFSSLTLDSLRQMRQKLLMVVGSSCVLPE